MHQCGLCTDSMVQRDMQSQHEHTVSSCYVHHISAIHLPLRAVTPCCDGHNMECDVNPLAPPRWGQLAMPQGQRTVCNGMLEVHLPARLSERQSIAQDPG